MEGKIFKVTYSCGYAGTDETDFVIAKCKEQAEVWANEGLFDYIQTWEHLVQWSAEDMDEDEYKERGEEYGEACFYDSTEYEDFVADCGFTITEATENDLYNWNVNVERIPDITEW